MLEYRSESKHEPAAVDENSSETTVFVRTNVTEKQRIGQDGEEETYYEFNEKLYDRKDWEIAQLRNELELLRGESTGLKTLLTSKKVITAAEAKALNK